MPAPWKSLLALLVGLGAAAAVPGGNAIDRLTTDDEVVAFCRSVLQYSYPPRFVHYGHDRTYRPAVVADSLGARDWWKTDFDHNGETDLLLFRNDGTTQLVFALARGGKHRLLLPAYAGKYGYLTYPVVKQRGGRSLVYLYHQEHVESDPPVIGEPIRYGPLACDTLVYQAGWVLNYTAHPRAHRVEQIVVENNGACEGNCPKMAVTIDAQRRTSTARKQAGRTGRRYRGTLSPRAIENLVAVLNYANFPQLAPNYRVAQFDETLTTLTVVYDGGKRKVIRDYGSAGTCTLAMIYQLALDVDWVPEP